MDPTEPQVRAQELVLEDELESRPVPQPSDEIRRLMTAEVDEKDLVQYYDVDAEELSLARIPLLTGSTNKRRYLSYRAMGFSTREAAQLADVSQGGVARWRNADPEFKHVEVSLLRELQTTLASDIIRMEFLRCMRLAMNRDQRVLYKAAVDLGSLTDREFQYLQKIRSLYTPGELIQLDKATAPDVDDRGSVTATLQVTLSGEAVNDEGARRAAARKLLEQFTVNTEVVVQMERPVPVPEQETADVS
jgi:hypothetical protein